MGWQLVLISVVSAASALAMWHVAAQAQLQLVHQWTQLEYDWSNELALTTSSSSGVPIDVQPFYVNGSVRILVTVPRFEAHIPYSLAIVSAWRGEHGGPLLLPYPSAEWNHLPASDYCDGITSAFRVALTPCQQLWVIDTGRIGERFHCPPQLLLFDLLTDGLLHRYRFNESVFTPHASLLGTPVAVVHDPPAAGGQCKHSVLYIADVTHHGLIVYDFARNEAWRLENKFMYPDPDYGTHTIAGESFNLMDGIVGMASDGQQLYFHPMASVSEYAVPLSELAEPRAEASLAPHVKHLGERHSACVAEALDSRGNMYCVTFNPIHLIVWPSHTHYTLANMRRLEADARLLEFVSGLKVVRALSGDEELWLLSNRFQKVDAGTISSEEINFRILKLDLAAVQHLISGQSLGAYAYEIIT